MESVSIKDNKVITDTDKKELIEKALLQVLSFFNKGKLNFKIIFLNTRSELDNIRGYKTKKWEVGGYYGNSKVYIFDEKVFNKVSNHPKKYYYSTLVHEIVHVYTEKILKFVYPIWLTEGLAYVIAEQGGETKDYSGKNIKEAYSNKDWEKKTYYGISYSFTKHLLCIFGKEKIFNLMNSLKKYEKEEDFYKKFNEILERDFNDIYEEYQKRETFKY